MKTCNYCLMDESAADIIFDMSGRCNYCKDMTERLKRISSDSEDILQLKLNKLVKDIKYKGNGKPYDCIVGLSGGADSAYALYLACKNGLRPLAVHMDNGWNSELAVNNIESLVKTFKVDLFTYVVNWREYRKLQQAFFDADVIDIELLYDNAMLAVNYDLAKKYNIEYILSGSNSTTEGMRVPSNFNWYKFDRKNIKSIASSSNLKVTSLPTIGVMKYLWRRAVNRIKWVHFLDYTDYDKSKCIDLLVKECGYRPYPYKHYESIFTRFYQGYILPTKFGVDKRKMHLSSLICSGQMSRVDAVKLISQSPYPNIVDLEADLEYFLKKMDWSENDLLGYINRPAQSHAKYASESYLYEYARSLFNFLKSTNR